MCVTGVNLKENKKIWLTQISSYLSEHEYNSSVSHYRSIGESPKETRKRKSCETGNKSKCPNNPNDKKMIKQ